MTKQCRRLRKGSINQSITQIPIAFVLKIEYIIYSFTFHYDDTLNHYGAPFRKIHFYLKVSERKLKGSSSVICKDKEKV